MPRRSDPRAAPSHPHSSLVKRAEGETEVPSPSTLAPGVFELSTPFDSVSPLPEIYTSEAAYDAHITQERSPQPFHDHERWEAI